MCPSEGVKEEPPPFPGTGAFASSWLQIFDFLDAEDTEVGGIEVGGGGDEGDVGERGGFLGHVPSDDADG